MSRLSGIKIHIPTVKSFFFVFRRVTKPTLNSIEKRSWILVFMSIIYQANPGVMPNHLNTVAPQRRIISHDMTIIVNPNLNASPWLYWFVL